MKSQQDLATAKLEKEKVGKLLLHYSIPAIIGMVVTSLYNIVDLLVKESVQWLFLV